MFTGIVEGLGKIVDIKKEGTNVHYQLTGPFTNELKVDQSVAHNGVCLTVTKIKDDAYWVTAIDETLKKTALHTWSIGSEVNLERCMQMNGRLDGHIVQGHVDTTAKCIEKLNQDGSWIFTFAYQSDDVTVEKGSVTVNGTSLTVVNSKDKQFSVAIIPYTYEHTVFKHIEPGTEVNLEFDIIGKYVAKLFKRG